jgi:hypothetical protein
MSFTPLVSTKIIPNSVQTTQETTQKITTGTGVKASVLFVNNYPTEDIVVLLHDSPTVITLRDVMIKTQDLSDMAEVGSPSMSVSRDPIGIQDICKGAELIVTDFGVWNMYTAVMRGGSVIVCGGKVHGRDSDMDIGSKRPPEVILPARRKRVAMR